MIDRTVAAILLDGGSSLGLTGHGEPGSRDVGGEAGPDGVAELRGVRRRIRTLTRGGLHIVIATRDGHVRPLPEDGGTDDDATVREWLASRGIGPGLVLLVRTAGAADSTRGAELLGPGAERAVVVDLGHAPSSAALFQLADLLDEQLRRRREGRVSTIDDDPAWTLHETGTDLLRHRVTETLLTIGGAGFATRGAVEEDTSHGVPLVLGAGVYDGDGSRTRLLPGPGWTRLDIDPAPGEDHRILDLRSGVLLREEVGTTGIPVRTLRFAPVDRPGTFVLRGEAGRGRLAGGEPLRAPAGHEVARGSVDDVRWARTHGSGDSLGGIGAVAWQRTRPSDGVVSVDRVAGYVRSSRRQPSITDARRRLVETADLGVDRLLVDQRERWARRWDVVGVDLPDDPETERSLRFALFQLWTNATGRDDLAVGARGLSGQAYSGHVFWDSDAYILPAVVTIDPAAAAAMVRYRLRRLDAARGVARAAGHAGARFPWESAAVGVDVTPTSARVAGEDLTISTGEREEHITADVAWGAVRLATWRGSRLDRSAAYPLLVETARYWASRCSEDGDGSVHIRRVMGPDEYHALVDDNAFTNVMARWNLATAARVRERRRGPDQLTRRWRSLAKRLADGLDRRTLVYEQFAGYDTLRPLLATDIAPPPFAADLMLGRDVVGGSQIIKQPDVLMLHQLVPEEVAPGSLGPNLDRYVPRTSHGSSLSPAVTASLLGRGGRTKEGLELLRLALRLDLEDLTGTTAGGLHLATLAGSWTAVLEGFLGVHVADRTLHLDPRLPPEWRRVEVRFRCLGQDVRLQVRWPDVTVSTSGPVRVSVAGMPAAVVRGTVHLTVTEPVGSRPGAGGDDGIDGRHDEGGEHE